MRLHLPVKHPSGRRPGVRRQGVPRRYMSLLLLVICAAVVTTAVPQINSGRWPSLGRRVSLIGATGCTVLAASSCSGASATRLYAPAPHSAESFWDSMGVNTHLYYSNTPYKDTSAVISWLKRLDIRHVRDGLAPSRPDEVAALQSLGRAGIKSSLIVGAPGSNPAALLLVIKTQLSADVEAVEGPNEYWRSGSGWQERLVPFQSMLFSETRSLARPDPPLVVGPSVGGLNLARYLNRGNIHPYPGGGPPEGNIAGQVAGARETSGSARIWATETGYHDATNMEPGTFQPAASDAAQAIYLPRVFASYFAAGVSRTYLYELIDEFPNPARTNPQDYFGLLTNSLQPKPQFWAVSRLAHAVADKPTGTVKRLRYSIVDRGSGLRQVLLYRSDGSWQILLWRPLSIAQNGTPSQPGASLTLRLPICAQVSVMTPSRSQSQRRLGSGTTFRLSVGGSLDILHVTPRTTCSAS